MPPVASAWLALVGSLLRSGCGLHLQVLALQHQVAVYQQTIRRPRLSPTDRVFWSWLSWLWTAQQVVEAFSWDDAPRSPWQNLYVERLSGSIRRELLAQVIVLNERYLTRLLTSSSSAMWKRYNDRCFPELQILGDHRHRSRGRRQP